MGLVGDGLQVGIEEVVSVCEQGIEIMLGGLGRAFLLRSLFAAEVIPRLSVCSCILALAHGGKAQMLSAINHADQSKLRMWIEVLNHSTSSLHLVYHETSI